MLQQEAGKNFQNGTPNRFGARQPVGRAPFRVMVLDPVLASRFLLGQAVAQPRVLVDTVATTKAARALLDRHDVSLILCEERLEDALGVEFLAELRESHPRTLRALVTQTADAGSRRERFARAGLCFVLGKPWSASSLRIRVREALNVRPGFDGWLRLPNASEPGARRARLAARGRQGEARQSLPVFGLEAPGCSIEIVARLRAELVRTLAARVSQELRAPVEELAIAIDRLRGEAARAGMSIESLDRVSCESERVARVVEHLEGVLLLDSSRLVSTSI